MPEQKPESAIIKPDYKMDLSLFTQIMPCLVVDSRVVCLTGIEKIDYDWTDEEWDALNAAIASGLPEPGKEFPCRLAITYASGNVEFFDKDEEKELEDQIKTVIKRGNAMAQLQARVQELEQELARRIMNDKGIVMHGRTGSFRKQ